MTSALLDVVKRRLAQAQSLVVLTGAGISADSGVPTFRGADGLWRNFRAEDLATPEAFARDPRLVWEWYDWRRSLISTKHPNAAHYALVAMQLRLSQFRLITQNVDGLHEASGSTQVIELHGNIWKLRCTHCHRVTEDRSVPMVLLPYCSECGALLRPHIVWFGESLDADVLDACAKALRSCEVFLVIGTSGVVFPAAGFASIAHAAGAFVAAINLDPLPQSAEVDAFLRGRAADIVPALL